MHIPQTSAARKRSYLLSAVVIVLLQRYAPIQAFTELNVFAFVVCLYFAFLHFCIFAFFAPPQIVDVFCIDQEQTFSEALQYRNSVWRALLRLALGTW